MTYLVKKARANRTRALREFSPRKGTHLNLFAALERAQDRGKPVPRCRIRLTQPAALAPA